MQRQLAADLARAAGQGSGRLYVAAATSAAGRAGPDAVLLLHQAAGPADMLQGYCAALMLAWGAQAGRRRGQPTPWPAAAQRALANPDAWLSSGGSSSAGSCQLAGSGKSGAGGKGGDSAGYAGFLDVLAAAGWDLGRVALMQGRARLVWGSADLHSK